LGLRLRSALHGGPVPCKHSRHLGSVVPSTPHGCEECLRAGEDWVHLRLCLTCGHVGCCQDSVHKHARLHALQSGHPVVRQYAVDETPETPRWLWCFECETFVSPG
jgi:CPA1 family monovalent cation:H+ antiporter